MWLTLTLFWAHVFTWFLTEKLMLSIDLYLAMKDFLSHYGILQQVRHFSLSVINSKSLWMQCHSIQGCWKAMIEQLVLLFARTPASEQEWLEISTLFEKLWKCQNVLWAIDGKLITIIKPKDWLILLQLQTYTVYNSNINSWSRISMVVCCYRCPIKHLS